MGKGGILAASGTTVSEDGNLEDPHLYLRSFANGSAELAVANIAFAVLLSAKISILQRYFFSFDQTIRWHAWFGRLGFLEALYHATFQIQYKSSRQLSLFDTLMYSTRYKTGTYLSIAMLCFVLGSHPLIRFISYRFFRIIHLASFAALVLLGCWHHWSFYVFYMAVLLFWVTNQLDRSYETQSCSLEALPANIVRVRCDVSRATGKRTKSLYAMAEQQSQDKMIKIRVSRPLGRPFLTNAGAEFGDFETVVLVAEGMGITPWIAVLQYIEQKEHAIKTRSVHLIWSVHGIDTFYAFEQEFDHFVISVQLELSIEVYVTGPSDPEESYSIPNNLTCIRFTASCRPNYKQLFKSIHQGRPEEDSSVALGICAHEETLVKASNLALNLSWDIRKERFEL
ncbi:MAG: hypothetical protein EXX96DRAFT_602384 [Benjaminiella poitrasii]|nr:MAG: hypothetical protein EXX96DRAFT_602384 [Benjaminiella poitrasii]